MADNDDDALSQRELHFNQQRSSYRSSLRSEKSTNPPPQSRTSSLPRFEDFDLDLGPRGQADRADSETLPSPGTDASPAPNVPFTRPEDRTKRKKRASRGRSSHGTSRSGTAEDAKRLDELLRQDSWLRASGAPPIPLHALQDPSLRESRRREDGSTPPSHNSRTPRSRHSSNATGHMAPRVRSASQLDITALPVLSDPMAKHEDVAALYVQSKPTPLARRTSRWATELYTVSYLIFFAIWGTLARVGLQALNFYHGAPVGFSVLWANVTGTFIMGFLAEDRRLFRSEWGSMGERLPEPVDRPAESEDERQNEKARHGKVKKTIPMYIGLATGFCGSFTSFSSFIRDVFLSLSNDLRTPINHPYPANVPIPSPSTTNARNGGYSILAILAVVIVTISTCYAALKVGAHFAVLVDPITPTFPFRITRRIIDPIFVFLAWGSWLGAVLMTIFPVYDAWRGQALFACIFAPLGCILRYYLSIYLNPIMTSFPLGTFTVNMFGTAVLGMAFDLQHVPLQSSGLMGGSIVGCQVLQGIMDGFCGCLTTVSTWMVELDVLKRRYAYIYGGVSVAVGLGLSVIIMGSVRWSVGWSAIICTI